MRKVSRNLKNPLVQLVLFSGIIATGTNYFLNHNHIKETKQSTTARKIDGPLSYTEAIFGKSDSYFSVRSSNAFTGRGERILDRNNDGRTDIIIEVKGILQTLMNKNPGKHYDRTDTMPLGLRLRFEKADEKLKLQKKRFAYIISK